MNINKNKKRYCIMHGKTIVYVFIAVIIAIFAIYYFSLTKDNSELTPTFDKSLVQSSDVGAISTYSGVVLRVEDENFRVLTENDIVTFAYSDATKFYDATDTNNALQLC